MIIKSRVAEPTSTEIKLSRELSVESLMKLWTENKKTLFRIKLNFNLMWLMVENVWNELDVSARASTDVEFYFVPARDSQSKGHQSVQSHHATKLI